MRPAIYFHPEAYTTTGPRLMGRHAAGESFLRGFLRYSTTDEFWVQVEARQHAQSFAEAARSNGRNEAVRVVEKRALGNLRDAGLLYYPGGNLSQQVQWRSFFGNEQWSVCGVTHTTASAGMMDALADLLVAPVQPWDAVICTSTAVKENVKQVLQAQATYLQQRLGATRFVLPQLPVIPLGIHTGDFNFDEAQRATARAELGADANTHVVLFVGRLSFHAKAHPLAMYRALQQAADQLPAGQRILLVECGWFANDAIGADYAKAARLACPAVQVVTLDGRMPDLRQRAWAGADVFCSLSDNIQETFGIIPIEAMAAGLPVVVSDWDGYKDTVRDGIDGFRIPTMMPPPGYGNDLALWHAMDVINYDHYCGYNCSLVAVDIAATAAAFTQLFASPELRARMGAAGRARARSDYDWATIIPRYEALWAELADQRRAAGTPVRLRHPCPARLDPFHAFSSYPTATLAEDTLLQLNAPTLDSAFARLQELMGLGMVNFAREVLPTVDEARAILNTASAGPVAARELYQTHSAARQSFLFRALVWLLKVGLLATVPVPEEGKE